MSTDGRCDICGYRICVIPLAEHRKECVREHRQIAAGGGQ